MEGKQKQVLQSASLHYLKLKIKSYEGRGWKQEGEFKQTYNGFWGALVVRSK